MVNFRTDFCVIIYPPQHRLTPSAYGDAVIRTMTRGGYYGPKEEENIVSMFEYLAI